VVNASLPTEKQLPSAGSKNFDPLAVDVLASHVPPVRCNPWVVGHWHTNRVDGLMGDYFIAIHPAAHLFVPAAVDSGSRCRMVPKVAVKQRQ
jgi:hypothetical protein